MLFGAKNTFGVECDVETQTMDGWLLGHFRFWIGGLPVGDWEDLADLKSIWSWMYDFAYKGENRYEALLVDSSAEELFQALYWSVMATPDLLSDEGMALNSEQMPFSDIYSRFHISHIGMSSFDKLGMILFEDSQNQRVIWTMFEGPVQEHLLPKGEMQRVAKQFCDWFISLK